MVAGAKGTASSAQFISTDMQKVLRKVNQSFIDQNLKRGQKALKITYPEAEKLKLKKNLPFGSGSSR